MEKDDTKEFGIKKYSVIKYLKYHMEDGKSVLVQIHELQMIVHQIQYEGIKITRLKELKIHYDINKRNVLCKFHYAASERRGWQKEERNEQQNGKSTLR